MKTIRLLLALAFMAVVALSCEKSTASPSVDARNDGADCEAVEGHLCLCIEVYAPVCGCDGVTYPNTCHAECSNIFDYTQGPCN